MVETVGPFDSLGQAKSASIRTSAFMKTPSRLIRAFGWISAVSGLAFQAALLLSLSFLGALCSISGALDISIYVELGLTIPGYMVWGALLYAASGSVAHLVCSAGPSWT